MDFEINKGDCFEVCTNDFEERKFGVVFSTWKDERRR